MEDFILSQWSASVAGASTANAPAQEQSNNDHRPYQVANAEAKPTSAGSVLVHAGIIGNLVDLEWTDAWIEFGADYIPFIYAKNQSGDEQEVTDTNYLPQWLELLWAVRGGWSTARFSLQPGGETSARFVDLPPRQPTKQPSQAPSAAEIIDRIKEIARTDMEYFCKAYRASKGTQGYWQSARLTAEVVTTTGLVDVDCIVQFDDGQLIETVADDEVAELFADLHRTPTKPEEAKAAEVAGLMIDSGKRIVLHVLAAD